VIYLVRRAYLVDPPLSGTREIEMLLEGALTRLSDIDEATVFAETADTADTTLKGIAIEVAIEASDEATASRHGRKAIRSSLRRVGVSTSDLRLANGLTSEAPSSTGA
jgi:hypothetical protein